MSGNRGFPVQFQPKLDERPEIRIADALEFIAARMASIEYDTTFMRTKLVEMTSLLGAIARKAS